MILKLKKLNFIDKIQVDLSSFALIALALLGILNLDLVLHSLLTVVHLAFEWIELALEHLIEHIFHTTRKQSQVIVFYLILSIGFGGLYYLWHSAPHFYRRIKNTLIANGMRYKTSACLYWQKQSPGGKLSLIAGGLLCVKLLYFLILS